MKLMYKMKDKCKKKGETKLKKTMNKLLACMLVVALGLSSYPVYALDTTDESNKQVEDTNAKIGYQLPEDNVVVDNVEPNDDVEPQAEVEPEDDVEPPADDSTTINLADDTKSSNAPKLDDLASDDSQLVIPQGEDEHDNSTFSGIVPYSTTVGGVTVTGGDLGVDYIHTATEINVLTNKPLTISGSGNLTLWLNAPACHGTVTLRDLHLSRGATPTSAIINSHAEVTIRVGGSVTLERTIDGRTILQLSHRTKFVGDGISTLTLISNGHERPTLPAHYLGAGGYSFVNIHVDLHNWWAGGIHALSSVDYSQALSLNGWDGVSSGIFPAPSLSINTQTAKSLAVTTTNTIPRMFGQLLYSLDGSTWLQNGGMFPDLKSSTQYTIYAKHAARYGFQESPITTYPMSTKPAVFEVEIPSGFHVNDDDAPKSITVKSETLDLGHNGQVDVTIISGVDNGGLVPLTRSYASNTIYSQLLVDNIPFTDTTQSIATFTMDTQTHTPVPISFATPTESDIPAGQYQGVVTFSIEYSD